MKMLDFFGKNSYTCNVDFWKGRYFYALKSGLKNGKNKKIKKNFQNFQKTPAKGLTNITHYDILLLS